MTAPRSHPDLSRVPRILRLRLSDEVAWASDPWDASSAAEAAAGIRRAWHRRIEAEHPGSGHPQIALRRRLAEIEAWLSARRARQTATDDARRSWEEQAAHWRYQAERAYGARPTLHLQVEGPRPGDWLGPWRYGAGPSGPLVSAVVSADDLERSGVWRHCRLAWAHAEAIDRFAGHVADWVRQPDLHLVVSRET